MRVSEIRPEEYPRAVEIWEASVRATHDFVTEADIDVFWPVVRRASGEIPHLAGLRDDDGQSRSPAAPTWTAPASPTPYST
jgi:putative acetyltransferase